MHRKDDDPESSSADLFDREQIRDYLGYVAGSVRRRRTLAAAIIAGIMVLALLALPTLPKTYHVEARLLAQKNPALSVRGDAQDAAAPTRGAVEAVRRRDNLVALIEATDLVRHWADHRAPSQRVIDALRSPFRRGEDEQDRIDALVEQLEKRLVAWTSDGTVSIAIDWPDARMASRLVDLAQQNLLETRYAQEITALSESIAILRSHAAILRGDVDDAVAALEKLRDKRQAAGSDGAVTGASTAPGSPGRPRAAPPTRRAAETRPEAEQIQVALNAKRRALDDLEEVRRHRLSELGIRLAEQRATYTDNHPVVIDLQQAIATLQAPSPQIKALRDEVATLRAEYERMSGSARGDAPGAPLGRSFAVAPPQLPGEILRLDQELREDKDPATVYARAELRDAMDKYAALSAQVQAAQIDLETAQAAFKYRYSVISPAKIPKRPVKPSVPLMLLAALVAAIVCSIVVVVVADVRSGRLCERWQIERLLDQPILGDVEVARLPAPRGHRVR
jgi:hypothetical protein